MNKYLNEFLSLKCSGDVLNTVNPLGKKSAKEITESMGIIKSIKSFFLEHPMEVTLIDLCAGNALTSVLAVHLLPVKYAIAVDKKERYRRWDSAKRFQYIFEDIYSLDLLDKLNLLQKSDYCTDIYQFRWLKEPVVIISSHPCSNLAVRIIELYNSIRGQKALVLIPCCRGGIIKSKIPQYLVDKLGNYGMWSFNLWEQINSGNVRMVEDKSICSPCNIKIIVDDFK